MSKAYHSNLCYDPSVELSPGLLLAAIITVLRSMIKQGDTLGKRTVLLNHHHRIVFI